MGAFSFAIPQELQQQLARLANIDELAPVMLSRAAPIVQAAIKAKTPKDTGALAKSLKIKKPQKAKSGGWSCDVIFDGKDERSEESKKYPVKKRRAAVSNAIKAAVKEYGSSKRKASPFIRPAVESVKDKTAQVMQTVITEGGDVK